MPAVGKGATAGYLPRTRLCAERKRSKEISAEA
jgi:hypothetical protein